MAPRKLLRAWLVVCLCISAWAAVQQTPAAEPQDFSSEIAEIRRFVVERMRIEGTPGLSIGFAKGDFLWAEGFGHADLENGVPARPDSSYRMASVTKPMTAVGLLILAQEGKVDLGAEVQRYVPYFPRKQHRVRVRQLLGHLGGIPHYVDYNAEGHFKQPKSTRESIRVFEDFELVAEPGSRFVYSSYGYNLLGAVIEGASGKSYGEFMKERVWDPLGMSQTRMDDPEALIPNRVRGYRTAPDGRIVHSEFVDISSRFAAGGTRSTVVDLLKFARGVGARKLLSESMTTEMFTTMAQKDGRFTGYGMGWNILAVNGLLAVAHSGAQPETTTQLIYFPSEDFAVALATNFEDSTRMPYVKRLVQLVLGEPWNPELYAPSREQRAVLGALSDVYNHGVAGLDPYLAPMEFDDKEVGRAFDYFEAHVHPPALVLNYTQTRAKIRDGVHPVTGRPFPIIGAYMTTRLLEQMGEDRFGEIRRMGVLPFFSAYVHLYDSEPGIPRKHRFPKVLEQLIKKWNEDWAKTATDSVQEVHVTPSTDFDRLGAELSRTFKGASVYPDFSKRLAEVIESRYLRGDVAGAASVAEMAVSLYPESDLALVEAARVALARGQQDQAKAWIAKARQVDPDGAAAAERLNTYAYQFQAIGQIELGLEMLRIARELYPEVANLYDSTGELLLAQGRRELAAEYYEKALEVDPDLESARRMLQQIRTPEDARRQ